MDPTRFVGSAAARCATLVLAGICVTALQLQGASSGASRLLLWLAIASGVLAFIALIFSFQLLYAAWLRFAERVQTVVVGFLFGSCYLIVVPAFRLFTQISDPLRLRGRSRAETFWIERQEDSDPASLERMG